VGIISIIRGKHESRPEGAKRPTAWDEPRACPPLLRGNICGSRSGFETRCGRCVLGACGRSFEGILKSGMTDFADLIWGGYGRKV